MPAKEPAKRRPLTVERVKAFMKSHAGEFRRKPSTAIARGGGGAGILGVPQTIGGAGGGLLQVGVWGLGGAVLLASMFVFPAWLSPLGVALFLYGWWRKNPTIKGVGLLLIGVQIAQATGVVDVASQKIAEIKKEGLFKALEKGTGGGGGGGNAGVPRLPNVRIPSPGEIDKAAEAVGAAGAAIGGATGGNR
jgi:hypothetical protein